MSLDMLEPFFDDGWIDEVIRQVKSGKEADVYMCRAGGRAAVPFVAAKVYRPLERRGFRNDSVYRDGSLERMKRRQRVAAMKKTSFGREVLFGSWLYHEYETLRALHAGGARVPQPLAVGDSAIVEEWIGDEDGAAPHLRQVRLPHADAPELFEGLISEVRLWLSLDVVHGDLSEYNVLVWAGGLTVIDFPQAVDPRFNRNAYALLARDIANICRHFGRYGIERDPRRLAGEMWARWLVQDL